jgi:hypothetical protein
MKIQGGNVFVLIHSWTILHYGGVTPFIFLCTHNVLV